MESLQREKAVGFPGYREHEKVKPAKERQPLMLVLHIAVTLGAIAAVYFAFLREPMRAMIVERQDTAAYAREHVEIEVEDVRDPGGMWQTVPVSVTITNDGPLDIHKLEIAATFLDEEGELIWKGDSARNLKIESENDLEMLWRFSVGGEIGSDVEKANRVRSAVLTAVRAWTRDPE